VLNNPENKEIKEDLVRTSDLMKNPFVDVFHWTKGQILDLQAISFSIKQRHAVQKLE